MRRIEVICLIVALFAFSASGEQGGPETRQVEGRPGYRPHMTQRAWKFHEMYKEKAKQTGGKPGFGYNLMRFWMTSQRQWPDAPEMTPEQQKAIAEFDRETDDLDADGDLRDAMRAATRHYTVHGQGLGSYDIPPSEPQEKFIEEYHKTAPEDRTLGAQLFMSSMRATGVDTRPAAVRAKEADKHKEHRAELEKRREDRIRHEENKRRQDDYDAGQEYFEQVRAKEAVERLKARIKESRETSDDDGGSDSTGSWSEMSPAEQRDALKRNEGDAWSNFAEILEKDPDAAIRILDSYSSKQSKEQEQRAKDGMSTMQQNTDIASASTSGDAMIRDSENIRDGGGRDAGTIREESAARTASEQREESWGKHIGDAIEEGIVTGGSEFGSAIGNAAAQHASSRIFGSDKGDETKEAPPPAPSDAPTAKPQEHGGPGGSPAEQPAVPGEAEAASPDSVENEGGGTAEGGDQQGSDPAVVPPTQSPDKTATASTTTTGTKPSSTGSSTNAASANKKPATSNIGPCPRCGVEHKKSSNCPLCLSCTTKVMSSYNSYCFSGGSSGSQDSPYFSMLPAGTRSSIEQQAARDRERWANRPKIERGAVDVIDTE